jgi:hypothetical protein
MTFKIFGPTYKFDGRLLALHLIYFALLLWVYSNYFLNVIGYVGVTNAFNINKAIFAPFAITAAFVLLRNNGLPSYFFLNIIIALTVTPSLVIFCGSDLPFSFIIVTWIAFAILAMAARLFRLRRIRTKHIDAITLVRWLAGLSLLYIASIFALGGGRFINFDISRVYEIRRVAAAAMPGIYEYWMSNFSQAIIPLLIVFIFCSFMIFALASHKAPLFIPIAVIFIYWLSRNAKVVNLTMLAIITIVVIGSLDFYLKQSGIGGIVGWFGSLTIYRLLLAPSLLNWSYFAFFSVHPYSFWSVSKFTFGLFTSPYDIGIPFLIGREVFGDAAMCANTGWIGSGMANAGYFGVGLYSFFIGLFLSFIDAYAKTLGYSLVVAVFLIPVMIVTTSTDLPTMLLTNGLLALLIMVILLKANLEQNSMGRSN